MTITGAEYISQILHVTPTLQYLDIGSNDIDDEGMGIISEALQHNKSLTAVRVDNCELSVKGIAI